ncbi:hypothetical protein CFC21_008371 [Triticum aestivum]|uniref:DC-UbP/UBTD2 N-terminal domain-containing protein n=2 Tax=Triticum aestivum TaxID=4565 RepID=A0A9R1ISE4_WHEAT|nr:hypothetical protein CFC21_008371 [Triticum aestivum]
MGCAGSTPKVDESSKNLRKPKPWKHTQPITPAQLKQMRDEFWDTAPHYGGQKEIWDALRAATDADLTLAQTIVDSAGIIVSNPDLTLCYDERGESELLFSLSQVSLFCSAVFSLETNFCGDCMDAGAKYELPNYVLSEPTNLIRDG